MALIQIAVVALMGAWAVTATPFGAPAAACVTMTPQHGWAPQPTPPIYRLSVTRENADVFRVTLTGDFLFKGFLIQARAVGSTVPLGRFEAPLPPDTRFATCTTVDDSVTHSINSTKQSVTFNWRSPGGNLNGVRFVATTCLDFQTFWVAFESQDLGSIPLKKEEKSPEEKHHERFQMLKGR
jgi:hypothetical protein